MLATAQSLIVPGMKSLVLPSVFLSNFCSRPSSQAVIASFVSRSIRSHVVFFACSIAESLARPPSYDSVEKPMPVAWVNGSKYAFLAAASYAPPKVTTESVSAAWAVHAGEGEYGECDALWFDELVRILVGSCRCGRDDGR